MFEKGICPYECYESENSRLQEVKMMESLYERGGLVNTPQWMTIKCMLVATFSNFNCLQHLVLIWQPKMVQWQSWLAPHSVVEVQNNLGFILVPLCNTSVSQIIRQRELVLQSQTSTLCERRMGWGTPIETIQRKLCKTSTQINDVILSVTKIKFGVLLLFFSHLGFRSA